MSAQAMQQELSELEDLQAWIGHEDDWNNPRVRKHTKLEMDIFALHLVTLFDAEGIPRTAYRIFSDTAGAKDLSLSISHHLYKHVSTFDFDDEEMDGYCRLWENTARKLGTQIWVIAYIDWSMNPKAV